MALNRIIPFFFLAILLAPVISLSQSKKLSKSINNVNQQQKIDSTVIPELFDFTELDSNPEEGFTKSQFYQNLMYKVEYPKDAIQQNIFGEVLCRVLIDTNGNSLKAILLDSANSLLFDAARKAVFKSIFPVGFFKGKSKFYWMNVRIPFPINELVQEKYKYDLIEKFSSGYAKVWKNEKVGLIDSQANEILIPKYEQVQVFSEFIHARFNGKIQLLDKKGNELTKTRYDSISEFKNGYAVVARNKNVSGPFWGMINKLGREIIPSQYYGVRAYPMPFSNNLEAVSNKDGQWIYVNTSGREITKRPYQETWGFWEGFAPVGINIAWKRQNDGSWRQVSGNWGFINIQGDEIIPLKYDAVAFFRDSTAIVIKGGKYGLVDTKGREIISTMYDSIFTENIAKGCAWVRLNNKLGVINYRTSKEIIPITFDSQSSVISYIREQARNVQLRNINLLHCLYDSISSFSYGYAFVRQGCNWGQRCGVIDSTLTEVIPCKYYSIGDYQDIGYTLHHSSCLSVGDSAGRWGFVKINGVEIVPLGTYQSVWSFTEGLAPVGNNIEWIKHNDSLMTQGKGEWGFIDTNGVLVIPMQFEMAQNFYDGLARVQKNGKEGMIDKTGKVLIPFKYDNIFLEGVGKGLARVHVGNKYGILNYRTGVEVVPMKFDSDNEAITQAIRLGLNK